MIEEESKQGEVKDDFIHKGAGRGEPKAKLPSGKGDASKSVSIH